MGGNNESRARDLVLRLLCYRQRSPKEVYEHLLKKGIEPSLAQKTCNYFIQNGYIDEKKLARDWILDGWKIKSKGPVLLSYQLLKKGVSRETIEKALEEYYPVEERKKVCKTLARKWLHKNGISDDLKHKKKLEEYLRRRGFDFSIIRKVVSLILNE